HVEEKPRQLPGAQWNAEKVPVHSAFNIADDPVRAELPTRREPEKRPASADPHIPNAVGWRSGCPDHSEITSVLSAFVLELRAPLGHPTARKPSATQNMYFIAS